MNKYGISIQCTFIFLCLHDSGGLVSDLSTSNHGHMRVHHLLLSRQLEGVEKCGVKRSMEKLSPR